ncbi:MAG: hypothetical protein AAGA83_07145 [Cyanobacteria bacterium P01_F01_bin.116]
MSSYSVYGDRQGEWGDEYAPIFPSDEFARIKQLDGIYNLVDDSQLTIKEQIEHICGRYGLPPVHWDSSRLSLRNKSVRVSNQKLKAAGYQLIHPQLES